MLRRMDAPGDAPRRFDVVQFGAIVGDPSTVGGRAARKLLVWIGPLSSTSVHRLDGLRPSTISVAAGDDVPVPLR